MSAMEGRHHRLCGAVRSTDQPNGDGGDAGRRGWRRRFALDWITDTMAVTRVDG
jgi:hypothetical protein